MTEIAVKEYLSNFTFDLTKDFFNPKSTLIDSFLYLDNTIPKYINEFWTSKQRQNNSIHEISYRACFKAELPRFFINLLSKPDDIIYDPFSGRGTTILEAALLDRNIISNDITPLSKILCYSRLFVPNFNQLKERLSKIAINKDCKANIDLSMFYHPETESEIVSLRNYLIERNYSDKSDYIDKWIQMVATNRLTGHSKNFFSVYTLPPNQATTQARQKLINTKRNQIPPYKNVKEIIQKKSLDLMKNLNPEINNRLKKIGSNSIFLTNESFATPEIPNSCIQLSVTSPPFLDLVNYAEDNWLRCWFNNIDLNEVSKKLLVTKNIGDWEEFIEKVFFELFRITKPNGWVAFEVGEIRNGKIKLDEHAVPLGIKAGFSCKGILINKQSFTKTANIWGIKNNKAGTNTNRIVLFQK